MKRKAGDSKAVLSDDELVELAKNGDTAAFNFLSDRYMSALYNRASRYANIAGVDLEDFLQEGLFALFRAVKSYHPDREARFGTYAITCINNSMTDVIRTHMKNLRSKSDIGVAELDQHQLQRALLSHSPVEDTYMDRESEIVLVRQVETLLSEFEQQVLKLYLRGHTYQQISVILSTATKAVDNALQRVRKKLRPDL